MEVFEALADPTRRHIVEMLAEQERSAGELGSAFPLSQPAISRHLRVLRDSGLVRWRGEAQRRIYRLEPKPLAEIDTWLEKYRRFWTERLNKLEKHLADAGLAKEDRHA